MPLHRRRADRRLGCWSPPSGRAALLYAWTALFAVGRAGRAWSTSGSGATTTATISIRTAAIKVAGHELPAAARSAAKQLLNFQATSWPEVGAGSPSRCARSACGCCCASGGAWCRRGGGARGGVRVAGTAADRAGRGSLPALPHDDRGSAVRRGTGDHAGASGRVRRRRCLAAFVASESVPSTEVHSLWVHDFLHPGSMLDARTAAICGPPACARR